MVPDSFITFIIVIGVLVCVGIFIYGAYKEKIQEYFNQREINDIKKQQIKTFKEESKDLMNQYESQYQAFIAEHESQRADFLEQKCDQVCWHKDVGIALSKDNKNLLIFSFSRPSKPVLWEKELTVYPPEQGKIEVKLDIPIDKILFFDNKESIYVYHETIKRDKMKAAAEGAFWFGTAGAIIGSQVKEEEKVVIENKKKETILMIRDGKREYKNHYPQAYYLYFNQLIPQKKYEFYAINEQKRKMK